MDLVLYPTTDTLVKLQHSHWTEYIWQSAVCQTRGNANFVPFRSWISPLVMNGLLPVSDSTSTVVTLLDVGLCQWVAPPTACPTFWEYVHSFGRKWRWQYVEGDSNNMEWLHKALEEGTVVMVMDGSYNQSLAPDISGAGWMIACSR